MIADEFPDEVWCGVFRQCTDLDSFTALGNTCRRFASCAADASVWTTRDALYADAERARGTWMSWKQYKHGDWKEELMRTAKLGHAGALQWLGRLDTRIPLTVRAEVLRLACDGGHIEAVRRILQTGIVPADERTVQGRVAIVWAAGRAAFPTPQARVACVQLLLDAGADGNVADRNGARPLIEAAMHGHDLVIASLLEWGAAVDARGPDGESALMVAAAEGHMDIVERLLGDPWRAPVEDAEGVEGRASALHRALRRGHSDVALRLLRAGADPELRTRNWETPLHLAASYASADVVRDLLARGVDVEAENDCEETALGAAAERGDMDVLRTLVEDGGARLDHRCSDTLPEEMARWSGYEETYAYMVAQWESQGLGARHVAQYSD